MADEPDELASEIVWIEDKLGSILAAADPSSTLAFVTERIGKLPDGDEKIRLIRLLCSAERVVKAAGK